MPARGRTSPKIGRPVGTGLILITAARHGIRRPAIFTRFEIGRIAGIPIYLDMMFVLVVLVFSHSYFLGGDTQRMSAGLIVVVGLLLSILLHELGHAFAGRLFKAHVSHIELTGLGGLAHFERSLPRSVFARTVIYLAGPAANLLLWLGLDALIRSAYAVNPMLALAVAQLAVINFFLMLFNLLPAYPLDGGHTLDAWLGRLLGPGWSVRIVAWLGLGVAVLVGLYALSRMAIFLLIVALFIAQANWQALQTVGRWR